MEQERELELERERERGLEREQEQERERGLELELERELEQEREQELEQEREQELELEREQELELERKLLMNQKLIEQLAALEHSQWIEWSSHVANTEPLSMERLKRWRDYGWVPYDHLSEEEKEGHRVWARKVIAVVAQYLEIEKNG